MEKEQPRLPQSRHQLPKTHRRRPPPTLRKLRRPRAPPLKLQSLSKRRRKPKAPHRWQKLKFRPRPRQQKRQNWTSQPHRKPRKQKLPNKQSLSRQSQGLNNGPPGHKVKRPNPLGCKTSAPQATEQSPPKICVAPNRVRLCARLPRNMASTLRASKAPA